MDWLILRSLDIIYISVNCNHKPIFSEPLIIKYPPASYLHTLAKWKAHTAMPQPHVCTVMCMVVETQVYGGGEGREQEGEIRRAGGGGLGAPPLKRAHPHAAGSQTLFHAPVCHTVSRKHVPQRCWLRAWALPPPTAPPCSS